ncbi:hypothetical protein MBANPS3_012502 [Mucor bainieri]
MKEEAAKRNKDSISGDERPGASNRRQRIDDDFGAEYGGGYDDNDPMWTDEPAPSTERVQNVHNRFFNPRKPRKDFWVDNSMLLGKAFIDSFQKFKEPDFRLEKPLEVEKPDNCDCLARRIAELTEVHYNERIYRLHEVASVDLKPKCYACDGVERKLVSIDGNFSWRRRKDRNPFKSKQKQGIFARSKAEDALIVLPEEVERFNKHVEVTDEQCVLQNLDSDFKAGANHRRQIGNRFDECSVYALAAVSHVVENLRSTQNLGVMYDIVCLCQKKIEQSIPGIQEHDPTYGVAIFHALAHSLSCQAKYFPRYVKDMALTGKRLVSVSVKSEDFVIDSSNLQ